MKVIFSRNDGCKILSTCGKTKVNFGKIVLDSWKDHKQSGQNVAMRL